MGRRKRESSPGLDGLSDPSLGFLVSAAAPPSDLPSWASGVSSTDRPKIHVLGPAALLELGVSDEGVDPAHAVLLRHAVVFPRRGPDGPGPGWIKDSGICR